eukprot:scaffold57080_cov63-Phaeocystis_antarctica.AAC.2
MPAVGSAVGLSGVRRSRRPLTLARSKALAPKPRLQAAQMRSSWPLSCSRSKGRFSRARAASTADSSWYSVGAASTAIGRRVRRCCCCPPDKATPTGETKDAIATQMLIISPHDYVGRGRLEAG